MPGFVLVVGVLVAGLSLFLWVRVAVMGAVVERVLGSRWLYGAALLRLLLGAGLIASADAVRYPQAVALLGWLFALSGITLVAIPAPAMRRMVGWFGGLRPVQARLWLSAGVALGLFFVLAALS
jgi:FtsH-binding integral membrane protein